MDVLYVIVTMVILFFVGKVASKAYLKGSHFGFLVSRTCFYRHYFGGHLPAVSHSENNLIAERNYSGLRIC